jgi:hypothetical protein
MKNALLGVIFSLFITVGSIASVSAGLNLPDEKKKKSEKREKCDSKSKKSCCESKEEAKKDCKTEKKCCDSKKAQ